MAFSLGNGSGSLWNCGCRRKSKLLRSRPSLASIMSGPNSMMSAYVRMHRLQLAALPPASRIRPSRYWGGAVGRVLVPRLGRKRGVQARYITDDGLNSDNLPDRRQQQDIQAEQGALASQLLLHRAARQTGHHPVLEGLPLASQPSAVGPLLGLFLVISLLSLYHLTSGTQLPIAAIQQVCSRLPLGLREGAESKLRSFLASLTPQLVSAASAAASTCCAAWYAARAMRAENTAFAAPADRVERARIGSKQSVANAQGLGSSLKAGSPTGPANPKSQRPEQDRQRQQEAVNRRSSTPSNTRPSANGGTPVTARPMAGPETGQPRTDARAEVRWVTGS